MLKFTLIAALTVPLLIGCATASSSNQEPKGAAAFVDDPRLGEQVNKICFTQSINGFSGATKDTVILSKSVNDDYLVEVTGGCYNLRSAGSIGLDTNLSCLSKFDNLVVSESAFSLKDSTGIGPQRCAIKAIYKWNKDAAKADVE